MYCLRLGKYGVAVWVVGVMVRKDREDSVFVWVPGLKVGVL